MHAYEGESHASLVRFAHVTLAPCAFVPFFYASDYIALSFEGACSLHVGGLCFCSLMHVICHAARVQNTTGRSSHSLSECMFLFCCRPHPPHTHKLPQAAFLYTAGEAVSLGPKCDAPCHCNHNQSSRYETHTAQPGYIG